MLDNVVNSSEGCLYEIRQRGQRDACYVIVPNPKVGPSLSTSVYFVYIRYPPDDRSLYTSVFVRFEKCVVAQCDSVQYSYIKDQW